MAGHLNCTPGNTGTSFGVMIKGSGANGLTGTVLFGGVAVALSHEVFKMAGRSKAWGLGNS